jgi:hypothetical protein
VAAAAQVSAKEPSSSLILIGFFGALAVVAVAIATRDFFSHERYVVAQAVLLIVTAFLLYQIIHYGGVERGDRKVSLYSGIAMALITILPASMMVLSHISTSYLSQAEWILARNAIITGLLLIVPLTFVVLYGLSIESHSSFSPYIAIPAGTLSLALYLGSDDLFGFLVQFLPEELLEGNAAARYLTASAIAIAFLIDVALSFSRLRRTVSIALGREREKMRLERRSHPLVARRKTQVARLLQFAILDIQRIVSLASTVFATGLWVLGRAVVKSVKGLISGIFAVGLGLSVLMVSTLLVQASAEVVLDDIAQGPWTTGEGWKRLFIWSCYFGWVGLIATLFLKMLGFKASDLSYSMTTVFVFLISGVWLAAVAATVVAAIWVPTWIGYRSLSPFVIFGFVLLLLEAGRVLWGQIGKGESVRVT